MSTLHIKKTKKKRPDAVRAVARLTFRVKMSNVCNQTMSGFSGNRMFLRVIKDADLFLACCVQKSAQSTEVNFIFLAETGGERGHQKEICCEGTAEFVEV